MTKQQVKRLLGGLPEAVSPGAPALGRRARYSEATRAALIDAATRQFTSQGYAGTSLDSIATEAQVTKGALYHHFTGKQALFEAVFERVEAAAVGHIDAQLEGVEDPWERASAGLNGFLEAVRRPAYQRVIIQEGPAVLGHERYREENERSSYRLVQRIVESVLRQAGWHLTEEMLQTFSRLLFGALSSAGQSIVTDDDSEAASERVATAVSFILAGLRTLAETGVELPQPGDRVSGDSS